MTKYIWTSEDGQYAVRSGPALKQENVEFDLIFVPEPRGFFRAIYRCDAKVPSFHCMGQVDKSKEPGARAATKAFARAHADDIKKLQDEGKRLRALRQKGNAR
jgi:hypothetical protein